TGQGKTPQDRFVFIEQNDLAPACAVFQCSEVDRAIGEVGRVGIESAGRAAVGQRIFFRTPRTLSRPSGMPVSRAKTVASSRQLHWESIPTGSRPWHLLREVAFIVRDACSQ